MTDETNPEGPHIPWGIFKPGGGVEPLLAPTQVELDPTAPVTTGEFATTMEWLGLGVRDISRILDVNERTARSWVSGRREIPDWLGDLVDDWQEEQTNLIMVLARSVESTPERMLVYPTDEDLWEAYPELKPWPASWWRLTVAQAAVAAITFFPVYPGEA